MDGGGLQVSAVMMGNIEKASVTCESPIRAFPAPEGPGLGVQHDWDFICKHQTGPVVYP